MKKLVYKVILNTTLPFVVIITVFLVFSIMIASTELNKSTDELLVTATDSWSKEFSGFFNERKSLINAFKHYIEDTLTLDVLAAPDKLEEYFEQLKKFAGPIVVGENMLNLYSWFAPEYTGDLMEISIRNMKLDGNITYTTDQIYTRNDINSKGWEWYSIAEKKGSNITDPYSFEGYEELLVSYTFRIEIDGKAVGVVGSDTFITKLKESLLSKNFQQYGYYALLNKDLIFLAHPTDEEKSMNEVYSENFEEYSKDLLDESKTSGILKSGNQLIGYSKLENGWILIAVPSMDELLTGRRSLVNIFLVLFVISMIVYIFLSIILASNITKPIVRISENILKISKGSLDLDIEKSISKRKDEIGSLVNSLTTMSNNLIRVVKEIRSASSSVSSGSSQMDSIAQQISSGTSEQASSTEEISSSMEELVSNIEQNSDNSINSNNIAQKASKDAVAGRDSVNKTVGTIKIISEKIAIIDEIARSTNMLALNAAIEAARAGEAGKGFAVVADEVRKLAIRSQESSKEISEISESSVRLVEDADQQIGMLTEGIKQTAELIMEISNASNEQKLGAEQVNGGILQLNEVIQQNATISEEMASMARELNGEALKMSETVSFFRFNDKSNDSHSNS